MLKKRQQLIKVNLISTAGNIYETYWMYGDVSRGHQNGNM